jgi:hypothetical protein
MSECYQSQSIAIRGTGPWPRNLGIFDGARNELDGKVVERRQSATRARSFDLLALPRPNTASFPACPCCQPKVSDVPCVLQLFCGMRGRFRGSGASSTSSPLLPHPVSLGNPARFRKKGAIRRSQAGLHGTRQNPVGKCGARKRSHFSIW